MTSTRPSLEQKQILHEHFAKKSNRGASLKSDPDAVLRRRKIEEIKENRRLAQEYSY